MSRKLHIYVAGPYTGGDPVVSVRDAILVGHSIMAAGHVPFVPHLNMLAHLLVPRPYEHWMEWCLAWVDKCDALVRLPGESPGADREVERILARDRPIYTLPTYWAGASPLPGAMRSFEEFFRERQPECSMCRRPGEQRANGQALCYFCWQDWLEGIPG